MFRRRNPQRSSRQKQYWGSQRERLSMCSDCRRKATSRREKESQRRESCHPLGHRPPNIDCWSNCRFKDVESAVENNFGLSVVSALGPPYVRHEHRLSPSSNKLKRHLHLHHRNDRLSKQRAPLVDWKLYSFSPPRRKLSKQQSHS